MNGRSIEIMQWIDEHPEAVGKAVILDDSRSAFVPSDYRSGLLIKTVLTSLKTGLIKEDAKDIIRWFNDEAEI